MRVAADVLGQTDPVEVPPALQSVRRFAPHRRASAGAVPLWTALCEDPAFRARVAALSGYDASGTGTALALSDAFPD